MTTRAQRQSIQPTYDSRETGPRYNVTTQIGDRTIGFQVPTEDPFVRTTFGAFDELPTTEGKS